MGERGTSLLELLFVVALVATVSSTALPGGALALDELRTAQAARYLSGRLARARLDAILASRATGLRFTPDAGGSYAFATYADGNANGLRTADITGGIDPLVMAAECLANKFPGVTFGLMDGVPDLDNAAGTGPDGVRIGTARIATMTPDGTATSGSLYVRGRRAQYAVRILGATGRVRVFRYHAGGAGWVAH